MNERARLVVYHRSLDPRWLRFYTEPYLVKMIIHGTTGTEGAGRTDMSFLRPCDVFPDTFAWCTASDWAPGENVVYICDNREPREDVIDFWLNKRVANFILFCPWDLVRDHVPIRRFEHVDVLPGANLPDPENEELYTPIGDRRIRTNRTDRMYCIADYVTHIESLDSLDSEIEGLAPSMTLTRLGPVQSAEFREVTAGRIIGQPVLLRTSYNYDFWQVHSPQHGNLVVYEAKTHRAPDGLLHFRCIRGISSAVRLHADTSITFEFRTMIVTTPHMTVRFLVRDPARIRAFLDGLREKRPAQMEDNCLFNFDGTQLHIQNLEFSVEILNATHVNL